MKQIKLNDFINFKFISGLEYSHDGKHACFVVQTPNLAENDYDANLWLYQVEQNRSIQLTALNKERGFIWLEDNEHIVFQGLRNPRDKQLKEEGEDLSVFYKINIHGGEAQEFIRIPLAVTSLEQIDADNYLILVTYDSARPALDQLDDREKAKVLKERKENLAYEVLEEIPYWSNGRGFINGQRTRIYFYNVSSNTWTPLTDEQFDVSRVTLNQDHTQAVVIGMEFQGKKELQNSLYILDIARQEMRLLSKPENFRYYAAEFMSDQKLLCVGNAGKHYGLNENPNFYVVDLNTGSQSLLTPGFDYSIGSSVGSDSRLGGSSSIKKSGNYLYFTTTEGGNSQLNRINIKGEITKLTNTPGSVDGFAVHDEQVLLLRLFKDRLQEMYQLDNKQERQLTHFNDWFTNERTIINPEPISYQVNHQIEIDGWVLKPVGWDKNKQYPAIFNIHGGPKTVYGEVYYHEMQYWANQGYFVFFCNPRGSDGKGNEFSDIRGKYGTIDYQDLMGFVDTVLEYYPSIDQERLGVTGGSYGGFMTNWIIGHTNRFKAAVSQRSISNWVSMGYTTDIGYYFADDQIGATPWTDIGKIWESSPLKYADQVKTPTLFIHSDEDYRCWVVEGLQMFTALKYHGVEARLCMFKGENHELSRSGKPQARIRRLKEITEWFDRYLK